MSDDTRTINRTTTRRVRRDINREAEPREQPLRAARERNEEDVMVAMAPPVERPADPARGPAVQGSDDPYGYYDEGPVRRLSGGDQAINLLDVPKHMLKPGWDAQYFTASIYNQPVEGANVRQALDAGWRAAKARDFPKLVMPGTPADGPVINYGQQLYIRPMHMSDESRTEEYQKALAAQRQRTQQSAQGQFAKGGDRVDDGGMMGNVDAKIVRPVTLGVSVEGEYGTWSGRGDR